MRTRKLGNSDLEVSAIGLGCATLSGLYGDYDADGLTATALLTRGLQELGGRVSGFVPNRLHDGYDFSSPGLLHAREVGASLVLTVDCGVTANPQRVRWVRNRSLPAASPWRQDSWLRSPTLPRSVRPWPMGRRL